MQDHPDSLPTIKVTLICRSECNTCMELLSELSPLLDRPHITSQVIDVSIEKPPAYAQGFVVPATYVERKLWRYGKYRRQELEDRIQQEFGDIPTY